VNPPPNEAIQALADVMGDDATREIVRLFLADFPVSIRKLEGSGRDEQLRIAHGLKSSALHMGAMELSARMAEAEDRLSGPGEPLAPEDFAAAVADFEALAPALKAYATP
jgi:HPt (histidine-containing phosphotransfer) domain-containing protein